MQQFVKSLWVWDQGFVSEDWNHAEVLGLESIKVVISIPKAGHGITPAWPGHRHISVQGRYLWIVRHLRGLSRASNLELGNIPLTKPHQTWPFSVPVDVRVSSSAAAGQGEGGAGRRRTGPCQMACSGLHRRSGGLAAKCPCRRPGAWHNNDPSPGQASEDVRVAYRDRGAGAACPRSVAYGLWVVWPRPKGRPAILGGRLQLLHSMVVAREGAAYPDHERGEIHHEMPQALITSVEVHIEIAVRCAYYGRLLHFEVNSPLSSSADAVYPAAVLPDDRLGYHTPANVVLTTGSLNFAKNNQRVCHGPSDYGRNNACVEEPAQLA
ncbi:hypothetical protein BJ166DRAFT_578585 [Pestalotiopsis sp. NC0098]|nr:hypothetical protein BJ166DRAFT_578585 [Pestalotiopsis sp. NC0098]